MQEMEICAGVWVEEVPEVVFEAVTPKGFFCLFDEWNVMECVSFEEQVVVGCCFHVASSK